MTSATTMTLTEVLANAPLICSGRIAIDMRSAPGRGKSTVVKELTHRMAKLTGKPWGLSTAFMGTMTPTDLPGFMVPAKDPDGGAELITRYTRPTWLTTEDGHDARSYEHGILFLDEFGQAEPDVKKTAAELLLNKRIGQWQLPPGWVVIAASNRQSDRSGVSKTYDFLINRSWIVEIKDDLDSLVNWMAHAGKRPECMAFCTQNPEVVFSDGVPDKQGPWATPRSVVAAFDMLAALVQPGAPLPHNDKAINLLAGIIGTGAAAQVATFLRHQDDLPRWSDVLANPETAKLPKGPDGQMLVIFSLAAQVDKDSIGPVVAYARRLPKEFGVVFVNAAIKRNPGLINTKAIGDWCANNAALIAAASVF